MGFYTIYNDSLLTAENESALTKFYNNVKPLPEDYEQGKYIVGDVEEEIEVPDYDEEGNETGTHTETTTKKDLVLNPNFEEEKEQAEKARIAQLKLTKREVFLALYEAKEITPDMVRAQITDTPALIEFDYATEYYRGNPLIDSIGGMLGYSSDDLDYLFINKEFPKPKKRGK